LVTKEHYPVRLRFTIAVVLALNLIALAVFAGCGGKSQMCTVSPVDIEELRSDSRDLNEDLEAVQARLRNAQNDLAAWQLRQANRRAELPELRDELARLKKASGVTEEMVAEVETRPREPEEIELVPRRPGE
jgi:outer membrane murein-binding lipoprotein Lpp